MYYYKVMSFGLKNVGVTYQRLVNKVFEAQIGRSVDVYVDGMLVKSMKSKKHIDDLEETLRTLRKY